MKPEPPPKVKGKTEWERFDNAVKKVFSVPREAIEKPSKPKRQPKRKAA